jgi:hypothetical protein
MRDWLIGLGVTLAVIVASWGLLILLAKRLPGHPARRSRPIAGSAE